MHELAVVEGILKVVLRHAEENQAQRVVGIKLRIGELNSVVESLVEKAFSHLSRGTIAEGASLSIEWLPVVVQCGDCNSVFPVGTHEIFQLNCRNCGGKNLNMISGREFYIEEIGVT